MTSPSTDRRFGLSSSVAIKAPVACATTANLTLSGEQTIDGVLTAGSRVLVKNQTSGVDNGIYLSDSGTWEREPDCDGARDLVRGSAIHVIGGTLGAGWWECSTTGTIVVGTTSIAFTQISSLSSQTSFTTISVSGAASFAGAITQSTTTDATSTTTGALQTLGGIGIAKAAWIGGLMNVAGVATFANATDASSSTVGGTIVTGGLAVAKKVNIGTTLTVGTSLSVGTTANIVGDFSVATNKFTVASATGNTSVAGTLTITGATAVGGFSDPAIGGLDSLHGFKHTADNFYALTAQSSAASAPAGLLLYYSGADPNGTGSAFLNCYGTTTLRAAIRSNGGLANFSANNANLSDARMKNIAGPLSSQWNKWLALNFLSGAYKDKPEDVIPMLTAQDVQKVYPELVVPFDEDNLGVRETPLYGAVMGSVVQELQKRVEKLEARA